MKAFKKSIPQLALVAVFLLSPALHAQKKPVDVSDSFFVNPGASPNIVFHTKMVGNLTQSNDTTWIFHGGEAREAAHFGLRVKPLASTAPLKFDDCAYFSPATQACLWNSRVGVFFSTHFFISPSGGGRAGSHVPASVRFYLDTARIETAMHNYLATDTFPQSLAADYLRPFYFRKYEVTNKEYREFVRWVTDSIARTRQGYFLPNGLLDWKKKYDLYDNATDSIINLMAPPERRFYNRKEIDSRKLIYRFQNKPEEFPADTLAIYPDTLSWMRDFHFSFNEHMENMYFWHPAYDDYPVTTVNYWQCLAFLDWKSMMLTKQFAKSKKQYKIVCSLPSEMEWDYASTAELYKEQLLLAGQHYDGTCDDSWLTDLFLTRASVTRIKIFNEKDMMIEDTVPDHVLSVGRPKKDVQPYSIVDDQFSYPMRQHSLDQEKTWGDFIYDGYFHTGPAKILPNGFIEEDRKLKSKKPNERSRAHYDNVTGICWMDGNVSEWLREDLDRNWRGIFLKHCVVPDGPYAEGQKEIVAYEKHYYDLLPAHGKLVRGANWMDERFAMKYGKNVGGTQAKTFCDPNAAHCTVGFRYVIYLVEK